MIKDGYLYIGTYSYNIAECKKEGHALCMKTWKQAGHAEGVIAQAEAQIFPESIEQEEPKKKGK